MSRTRTRRLDRIIALAAETSRDAREALRKARAAHDAITRMLASKVSVAGPKPVAPRHAAMRLVSQDRARADGDREHHPKSATRVGLVAGKRVVYPLRPIIQRQCLCCSDPALPGGPYCEAHDWADVLSNRNREACK